MTDIVIRMAEHAAREWGVQVRAHCYRGTNGYPRQSPESRARDGDLDFSAVRSARQHFDEVLSGDALLVSRAIHSFPMMPERLHHALFLRWVVPGKMDPKLAAESIDRRSFYVTLSAAHAFLAARLPANVSRETLCTHES